MILELETKEYTGTAAFKNYGTYGILCYKKGSRNIPTGTQFNIDGSLWKVAGTKTSPYVDTLVNVRLERISDA